MKKPQNTETKVLSIALVLSALFFAPFTSQAETLCYRNAVKNGAKPALQLFKKSCPVGFSAFSAEMLGVDKIFTQGAEGAQGIKGIVGPSGKAGLKGDTGPAGDIGIKGIVGAQGVQGPQGDAGPKGAIGDRGVAGSSASALFYFTGSTGNTLLGSEGDLQIYPLNQSGGPTSGFTNVSDLMIPSGSTCSAIVFNVMMDAAPGADHFWKFWLLRGSYASAPTQTALCSMTGSAKSCSFTSTLALPLSAETSVALLADKLGTLPPNTKARWSIRCTAS